MAFLHEKIDVLRESGCTSEVPSYIPVNLNPAFELRPYQKTAFENFITHFESPKCPHPTQVLFHMATGSGKTLMMAGLMLYLYKKGYRNFLFFVNLSTIVKKTEDNFLNAASNKYLFADEIVIDGERVHVKKVENFQATTPDAINICFSTTQGLHTDMWLTKENGISFDDLDENSDLGDKCQSLTHGEKPIVENFENANDEFDFLLHEVKKLKENGISLTDICVVARTKKLVDDYIALFTKAGICAYVIKRNKVDDRSFDGLRVATMHRVKGLEFKYVFIVAANSRIIPLPSAINKTDPVSEVESVTSEKCLLYVAMTRAQKGVYITSYGRKSVFLKS